MNQASLDIAKRIENKLNVVTVDYERFTVEPIEHAHAYMFTMSYTRNDESVARVSVVFDVDVVAEMNRYIDVSTSVIYGALRTKMTRHLMRLREQPGAEL